MIDHKITIKHFLNKNLKFVIIDGKRSYPVYSLITYKRISTQLKFFKPDGTPLILTDTEKTTFTEIQNQEINTKELMIKKCINYFVTKEVEGNLLLFLRKNISLLFTVNYFINRILFNKIQKHYYENNLLYKDISNQMAVLIDHTFKVMAQRPDVVKLLDIIYACNSNTAKTLKDKFKDELNNLKILQNLNDFCRTKFFSGESYVIQFENGDFFNYFSKIKKNHKSIYNKYIELDKYIKCNYEFNNSVNQRFDNKMDFID